LALLRRQPRILRLRHRRAKRVQHAGVLPLAAQAVQPFIHPPRVLPRQLRDAVNPQLRKIPQLYLGFLSPQSIPSQEKNPMNVKRLTTVLLVKDIEPIIPFWVDRLGFTKTIEVPDGNKLGFVAFQKGTAEVMYQTYASVEKDAPKEVAATAGKGPSYLYMEVDNLDAVLAAMKDVKLVMPVRTAFYGMREFSVQDPGGHFITFAQASAPPKH
jgi:uncharacterized glyoxalase superfamily protein PhnB